MTSFVNEIGQELNPGDSVLIITTGRCHRLNIRTGIFLGLSPNGGCQVESLIHKYKWIYKETEQEVPASVIKSLYTSRYTNDERQAIRNTWDFKRLACLTKTTLQRNRIFKLVG